jgi:hypothetical protein
MRCTILSFGVMFIGAIAVMTPAFGQASDISIVNAGVCFANGSSIEMRGAGGHFPLVATTAAEKLTIMLRFASNSNSSLIVQPLDGGVLASPSTSSIAADGTASIQFQPGRQPGLYRVLVNQGGRMSVVQFWVPDPESAESGPPALTATSGN